MDDPKLLVTGCTWTEDYDGPWDTSCGGTFSLNDGTPSQNRMAFCCYCGEALLEVPYVAAPGGTLHE